ncbi:hypothetical protein RSK20926_19572 [Roseobacter sp. SK209-2-6]|uniref:DUF192 domain-containing protein n=1 Tax=Roseobacter sp. SK209-2-6 TaxID=388739 RepID=UPI0000F3F6F4|nr:DUF192 domain-containing protein [Roseobacter sp. SK209-2-6]EBA17971.1 hypothetical protein RSK20926_19572 [Roseobacter sp. SK209-2-6]
MNWTAWSKKSLTALVSLTICSTLSLAGEASAEECKAQRVDLRGDWGRVSFTIEIADDEKERSLGLMHREHLPRGRGMLFVFPKPQSATFWMKNTLIPLDMIFVDQQGVVVSVHENAVPGDLTPIHGGDSIYSVLEINGGLAARYGISPGSQIRHEIFSKHSPIWPC